MGGKVEEVVLRERRVEFAGEVLRVLRSHAEADERPDVPEDRRADLVLDLPDGLVGRDEVQAILPRFLEDPG